VLLAPRFVVDICIALESICEEENAFKLIVETVVETGLVTLYMGKDMERGVTPETTSRSV